MASRKRTLLPIGIHLTADAVHMAQLDQGDGNVQMVSRAKQYFDPVTVLQPTVASDDDGEDKPIGHIDQPHYEEALDFIRQKITNDGFRGSEAVISLPSENLVIEHVRLPPAQPEEMMAALPDELQGKLPFDPKEAVVRHIIAGMVTENNETKQEVIVLAALRAVIEKQVTALTKMGLHVIGVGAEPCAMCYAYTYAASRLPATQEGPPSLMVVAIGSHLTQVAIVRGQETTFVKGVVHGADQLTAAIAKARGTSLAEAAALRKKWSESSTPDTQQQAIETYKSVRWGLDHFVDEIESCVRYHASLARGSRVDRLYFVGPQARDGALVKVLSAQLGVACDVGDPVGVATGNKIAQAPEPELAVAVGLSLFTAQ